MMNNPWNITDPFDVMFCDNITFSARRKSNTYNIVCTACVYPPEDVETFSDVDNESKIKKRKILILKSSLSVIPQTGDTITLDDNTNWKVDNVDFV